MRKYRDKTEHVAERKPRGRGTVTLEWRVPQSIILTADTPYTKAYGAFLLVDLSEVRAGATAPGECFSGCLGGQQTDLRYVAVHPLRIRCIRSGKMAGPYGAASYVDEQRHHPERRCPCVLVRYC